MSLLLRKEEHVTTINKRKSFTSWHWPATCYWRTICTSLFESPYFLTSTPSLYLSRSLSQSLALSLSRALFLSLSLSLSLWLSAIGGVGNSVYVHMYVSVCSSALFSFALLAGDRFFKLPNRFWVSSSPFQSQHESPWLPWALGSYITQTSFEQTRWILFFINLTASRERLRYSTLQNPMWMDMG